MKDLVKDQHELKTFRIKKHSLTYAVSDKLDKKETMNYPSGAKRIQVNQKKRVEN